MGSLTFGVRDRCVQRGRAGSVPPSPSWAWMLSSVGLFMFRRFPGTVLENSRILTEGNRKPGADVTAGCVSSGPASQDALAPPQAPPPQDSRGLLRPPPPQETPQVS